MYSHQYGMGLIGNRITSRSFGFVRIESIHNRFRFRLIFRTHSFTHPPTQRFISSFAKCKCLRTTRYNDDNDNEKKNTHTHQIAIIIVIIRTFEELAILPNGTVNEAYRPLTISMYHLHMHRWLEVFSREQLLVVNGDQLIEDPVSQLRRIEKFLGMYLAN